MIIKDSKYQNISVAHKLHIIKVMKEMITNKEKRGFDASNNFTYPDRSDTIQS